MSSPTCPEVEDEEFPPVLSWLSISEKSQESRFIRSVGLQEARRVVSPPQFELDEFPQVEDEFPVLVAVLFVFEEFDREELLLFPDTDEDGTRVESALNIPEKRSSIPREDSFSNPL